MKLVAVRASEEGWCSRRAGECVPSGEKGLETAEWLTSVSPPWECTGLSTDSAWTLENDQGRRGEAWLGGCQHAGGQWPRTRFTLWHLALLPPEYRCPTHPENKWGGLLELLRWCFHHPKEMGLGIPIKISSRTIQKAQFLAPLFRGLKFLLPGGSVARTLICHVLVWIAHVHAVLIANVRNKTTLHISWQNYNSKRYRHPYVHSSTIHNSQDMETTLTSINRWMDKEDVVHIYNGILLSHKKNEIIPFTATWIQLEIIILSEVSQKEKDKYHMISLICGI